MTFHLEEEPSSLSSSSSWLLMVLGCSYSFSIVFLFFLDLGDVFSCFLIAAATGQRLLLLSSRFCRARKARQDLPEEVSQGMVLPGGLVTSIWVGLPDSDWPISAPSASSWQALALLGASKLLGRCWMHHELLERHWELALRGMSLLETTRNLYITMVMVCPTGQDLDPTLRSRRLPAGDHRRDGRAVHPGDAAHGPCWPRVASQNNPKYKIPIRPFDMFFLLEFFSSRFEILHDELKKKLSNLKNLLEFRGLGFDRVLNEHATTSSRATLPRERRVP